MRNLKQDFIIIFWAINYRRNFIPNFKFFVITELEMLDKSRMTFEFLIESNLWAILGFIIICLLLEIIEVILFVTSNCFHYWTYKCSINLECYDFRVSNWIEPLSNFKQGLTITFWAINYQSNFIPNFTYQIFLTIGLEMFDKFRI